VAPGETCPTGLPMCAGVHKTERSISISVPNVLRDRSGATMVLGMSMGTSDDKSGVGSVIGMSGPCGSEISSQWLGFTMSARLCANERIILTHMSANHSDALI
jgi:hypothetical protein